MQKALNQANLGFIAQEVPVGAVVTYKNKVISVAHNEVEKLRDPTAHAELLAIQKACKIIQKAKLIDCDLYVSLEPCAMCAQAISYARIKRLYFAAYDPKSGGIEHGAKIFSHNTCHHKPEVYGGILEKESTVMLKAFFALKRN